MNKTTNVPKEYIRKYPPGQIPEHLNKHTLLLLNIPVKIRVQQLYEMISEHGPVTRLTIYKQSKRPNINAGHGLLRLANDKFYHRLLKKKKLLIKLKKKNKRFSIEVLDYFK
jgi:RNA recognition motif-containing protein